jgi:hypothetical protein
LLPSLAFLGLNTFLSFIIVSSCVIFGEEL